MQPEFIPNNSASPLPWTAPAPLYSVNTQLNGSTSTLGLDSSSSITSDSAYDAQLDEEIHHTTQKETIVGRRNTLTKAVSSAFAKTLTRIRSRGALNEMDPAGTGSSVVIGVVLEATTTVKTANAEICLDEVGVNDIQTTDPAPSRRMSMHVTTTEISTVAPAVVSTSRSRSGSIIKLRSKRSQTSENKSSNPQASSGVQTAEGANNTYANPGGNTSTDMLAVPASDSKASGQKQPLKLSKLAKTFAQKLRRTLSSDNSATLVSLSNGNSSSGSSSGNKEKEKEKTKVATVTAATTTTGTGQKENKDKIEVLNTISNNDNTACDDDQSKCQKASSSAPLPLPLSLSPPPVRVRIDETSGGSFKSLEAVAGIPLPPSPSVCRHHPSSPTTMAGTFPGVISAAMIPLPPSPVVARTRTEAGLGGRDGQRVMIVDEDEEDDEDDDEHQESHTGLLLTEFGTGSEPVIPEEVETSATDDSIGEEEAANTTANTIINTSTSTTPVL